MHEAHLFGPNPRDRVPVEFPRRGEIAKKDDAVYAFLIRPFAGIRAVVHYYDAYHHIDSSEREAANEVLNRLLDRDNPKGLDATTEDIYVSLRGLWKEKKRVWPIHKSILQANPLEEYRKRGKMPKKAEIPEPRWRFSISSAERALLDQDYLETIVELVKDKIIPFALEQRAVRIRDAPDMNWERIEGMQFIGEATYQGEKKAFYVPEGLLPESCKGTVERELPERRIIREPFF